MAADKVTRVVLELSPELQAVLKDVVEALRAPRYTEAAAPAARAFTPEQEKAALEAHIDAHKRLAGDSQPRTAELVKAAEPAPAEPPAPAKEATIDEMRKGMQAYLAALVAKGGTAEQARLQFQDLVKTFGVGLTTDLSAAQRAEFLAKVNTMKEAL